MAKPIRYLRSCGHPNDCTWFMIDLEGRVKVYCLGCLFEKLGILPCETYNSIESFVRSQGGQK